MIVLTLDIVRLRLKIIIVHLFFMIKGSIEEVKVVLLDKTLRL